MSRQSWALLMRRRTVRRTFVEQVELWRPTRASDGQGGITETVARVATWPGRVEPVNERSALVAERLGLIASAIVVLPHNASVLPGDELRVNGMRFGFVGSDEGTSEPLSLRVSVAALT